MPRSPSRDRSDRFTGNRGYFHRPDWYVRWKYVLAVLALVVAGAWAAVDVAKPTRAVYAHTHGPLANPHAAWDNDCAACHRTHGVGELSPQSLFQTRDRWHDLTCERCHAGPAHHAAVTADGNAFHNRCSNCHHDHGGRMNSLTRIADSHCTKCHADLTANHATGNPPYAKTITAFADHPEFRPLATPPESRTLKFSHSLHMTPGLPYKELGKEALTVGALKTLFGEAAAARYAKPGQGDSALVSLDCASCHALDGPAAGESGRSVPRAVGAYFQPVNFDGHCRACHPLTAPVGAAGPDGKRFEVPKFDVPHRKQPAELKEHIAAGYVRGLVAAKHEALAAPVQPGGRVDPRAPDAARTIREEADRLTSAATSHLRDVSCAKCHDVTGEKTAPVPDRTVWFTHAKFDHTAHRGVSCASCHPGTAGGGPVIEKEPVQILGVESCKACHSPAGTPVVLPSGERLVGGGVRHGCTDCHNYHNGDHSLFGRGNPIRAPARPQGIGEFLRGKRE